MNSAKLHDWLQIVGLFGVIASLMFVGMQMKQDREIALSAATQARTESVIQNIHSLASNPILASALDKIEFGEIESLLPSERRTLILSSQAALFGLENSHYQYLNGFISEDKWRASRETLKNVLEQGFSTRTYYETNRGQWLESFQQVVDDLILEIDSESVGAR